MKLIAVLFGVLLISSVTFVEAAKWTKPIIFIDYVVESRMVDQYIVKISICSPKILRHPSFEVTSDSDSYQLVLNKIVSKNKCQSGSLTIIAENPNSIKARLL